MKKLTAGILTVMLGLVVADANAAITSKKYVDDAVGAVGTRVTTLNTEVTNFKEGINTTINNRITEELKEGGALAGLEGRVSAAEDGIEALETTVGDETGGLVKDVAGLQTTVAGLTTGDASVDKKIENALESYTTTEDLEATYATKEALGEETTARTNADKAITDTIGTLPEGTATVAAGLTALSGKIDTINSATDGILKQAKDYTDDEIGVVNGKIGELGEDETVKGLIEANKTAISANKTAVEKAQADASQGIEDAAAAKAVADAAIKNLDTTASNGKYVLTAVKLGDQTTYAWEAIERADGEAASEAAE